jgi:hypothetical protein
MAYRLLQVQVALMRTVLDQRYTALHLGNNDMRNRILDRAWWVRLEQILQILWKPCQLIRFMDSDKVPTTPYVVEMVDGLQDYFEKLSNHYGQDDEGQDDNMFELVSEVSECMHKESQSGRTYTELLLNKIALFAHAVNPQQRSSKPWERDGCKEAIEEIFYKQYNQADEEVSDAHL